MDQPSGEASGPRGGGRAASGLRRRWQRVRRQAGGDVALEPDVELLVSSPLFDHEWYSLVSGTKFGRVQSARHYLSQKKPTRPPHPLIAPLFMARTMARSPGPGPSGSAAAGDSFLAYLRDRDFRREVHPLFDVATYLSEHPEALDHPDGPIGHYLDVGASAGARVNSWYESRGGDPRGLVDWLVRDAAAWARRRERVPPPWTRKAVSSQAGAELSAVTAPGLGTTSVLLVLEHGAERLAASVEGLMAQTDPDWELVVAGLEAFPPPPAQEWPDDRRITFVAEPFANRWLARNAALRRASGTHVAFLIEGDVWLPGRLASVREALATGQRWIHDAVRDTRPAATRPFSSPAFPREQLQQGRRPDLSTLVIERNLMLEVGGFDAERPGGVVLDLLLKLDAVSAGGVVPRLGTHIERRADRDARVLPANLRPYVDYDRVPAAADAVLNEHLIDYDALRAADGEPGLVSMIICSDADFEMTRRAVRSALDPAPVACDLEVVLIDDGCPLPASSVLSALAEEFAAVRVVHNPVRHGRALGNNIGVATSRGQVLVFVSNQAELEPGWLTPLLDSLSDPSVLAVQPLALSPGGAVQSAGMVFPRGQGLPHRFLEGFHLDDASGVEREHLHALSATVLAMRREDLVSVRGFDPLLGEGLSDVDLCLRLATRRPGHFAVQPQSRVIDHDRREPAKALSASMGRRIFVERWFGALPEDDVSAWHARGYEVIGHETGAFSGADRRLSPPVPVIRRSGRAEVREGVPSLRWAIKNPAPNGAEGERWGDTHFADMLAKALRSLGQEVVIDRRPEFQRSSGHLDDVVLLLRGLAPYAPARDQVNLMWVISHPDGVLRCEHIGWDKVYVASPQFTETMRTWGAPAVTLLQATDEARFHPGLPRTPGGPRMLFVGNSRRQARTLVMYAVERGLPLDVIGSGWDGLIPHQLVKGSFISNAELGLAYRSADVVLNDHWEDMQRGGFLSNRLFDAVACGARVISDPVPGMEEVFGEAVQVVRDADELAALVATPDLDAVFGTEEMRRRRAEQVLKDHSFGARARLLLEDSLRIRSARHMA